MSASSLPPRSPWASKLPSTPSVGKHELGLQYNIKSSTMLLQCQSFRIILFLSGKFAISCCLALSSPAQVAIVLPTWLLSDQDTAICLIRPQKCPLHSSFRYQWCACLYNHTHYEPLPKIDMSSLLRSFICNAISACIVSWPDPQVGGRRVWGQGKFRKTKVHTK